MNWNKNSAIIIDEAMKKKDPAKKINPRKQNNDYTDINGILCYKGEPVKFTKKPNRIMVPISWLLEDDMEVKTHISEENLASSNRDN